MTIQNEAVRLFFAISALILVGMLSTPTGGNQWVKNPQEIKAEKLLSSNSQKSSKKTVAPKAKEDR
jgi:hypothetical protein